MQPRVIPSPTLALSEPWRCLSREPDVSRFSTRHLPRAGPHGAASECPTCSSRDASVSDHQPAKPKNTRIARPSRMRSSSPSLPMDRPSLERGTVVILSTTRLHGSCSPFTSSGSTRRRKRGASVGSVVNAQTVTESAPSNRSSWMTATVRGFPTYPAPAAAVQISPRFKRRPG